VTANKPYRIASGFWFSQKNVLMRSFKTAASLKLVALMLLVLFAFPRLHQDIHRLVSHHGIHGSCGYGDENSLLCDTSCAECDYSFFMFPDHPALCIQFFLPISLPVVEVVRNGLNPAGNYGINQLRGPPFVQV